MRQLSASPYGERWKFSLPADFFFYPELKYYLPCDAPNPHPPLLYDEGREARWTANLRALRPELLRYLQVLDVYYYGLGYEEELAHRMFPGQFRNLQVMRGHASYFPMRGVGNTQVYFCLWEERLDMRL